MFASYCDWPGALAYAGGGGSVKLAARLSISAIFFYPKSQPFRINQDSNRRESKEKVIKKSKCFVSKNRK